MNEARRPLLERFLRGSVAGRCCGCEGVMTLAGREETEAVRRGLRGQKVTVVAAGFRLLGARYCRDCGHVTVLTAGRDSVSVWCPGFRLHGLTVWNGGEADGG